MQKCTNCNQAGHKRNTCPADAPPGTNRCTLCKTWKPLAEFPTRNKAKGELQRYCKVCIRPYRKRWYQRHKEEQVQRTAKQRGVRVEQYREIIRSLREVPCTDCGQRYHWVQMDFDHLDSSTKIMAIGLMVNSGFGEAKIRAELAKCEVVCANCHRLRTWNRKNPTRPLQPLR
jgi:hypothetical protein